MLLISDLADQVSARSIHLRLGYLAPTRERAAHPSPERNRTDGRTHGDVPLRDEGAVPRP